MNARTFAGLLTASLCTYVYAVPPALEVSLSDEGLPRLSLGDRVITAAPASDRDPQVLLGSRRVDYRFPRQGPPPDFGAATVPEDRAYEEHVDADSHTLTYAYGWGSIVQRYESAPGRLDIHVTVVNDSDRVLQKLVLPLLRLDLPGDSLPARVTEATFFGQRARAFRALNVSEPVVLPLEIGEHVLVAATGALQPHLKLEWFLPRKDLQALRKQRQLESRAQHGDPVAQALADEHAKALGADDLASASAGYDLLLTLGGGNLIWHDRYMDWQAGPGERTEVTVSLRSGSRDDPLAPARDILDAYAEAHPMLLDWPDRRPIVRSFLGDRFPYHPPAGPDFVKPEAEADEAFRKLVLDHADRLVEDMQRIDAQGMIIWNIEGNGTPRLKYVGQPGAISFLCPEADAVSDAFFRRILDAGFRTGICLRPSSIVIAQAADGSYFHRHAYPRDRDVVDVLDEQAKYAHERWGCTIFYVDTNTIYAMPKDEAEEAEWPRTDDGKLKVYKAMMNAAQWEELLRRNPGCLFSVEHSYLAYDTCQAPYDQMNMGDLAGAGPTPALARAVWPESFKVLTTDHPQSRYHEETVEAFLNRDVVAINSPVTRAAPFFDAARQEAAFRAAGPSPRVAQDSSEALVALALDDGAALDERYHAARRLRAEAVTVPPDAVAALCRSENMALTLQGIAMVDGPEATSVLPVLLPHLRHVNEPLYGVSSDAVARMGDAALPVLAEVFRTATERWETDAAARGLVALHSAGARDIFLEAAQDASAEQTQRRVALGFLKPWADDAKVVDAVLGLLDEPRVDIPAASVLAAGTSPKAEPALRALLEREQSAEKPSPHRMKVFQRMLDQVASP